MADERFSRIERMVGPEGMRRLAESHVTVVGLGAVGGYAVEALARASDGRLRLVDFDVIGPTNINRQLLALESTLGRNKAVVAAERVGQINPACEVEVLDLFAHVETMDRILAGPPDLLIDAIDSLMPKVELLLAACERSLPVLSCMGAALRTDPLAVRVATLGETTTCPLARQIRKRLRNRGGRTDITCVYSTEPIDNLPQDAIADYDESEPVDRGRARRTMGSLPTLTGIVGLTAANEALRMLLGDDFPRKR